MKPHWLMMIPLLVLLTALFTNCAPDDDDNNAHDNVVEDDDQASDDDVGDDDDNDNTSPTGDDDVFVDDDNDDTADDDLHPDESPITLIDGGGYGSSTSLAVLPDGELAISAERGGMPFLYRFLADESVQETALNNMARSAHSALAADAAGKLHLIYTDDFSHSLVYLTNASGKWAEEVLLTAENLEARVKPDLQLDANGFVHAVFLRADCPQYATNRSGVWQIQTVPGAFADLSIDLALDKANRAHLVFYGGIDSLDEEIIVYATNVGGAWSVEKVVNDPQIHTYQSQSAIALDSQGRPHVVSCSQAYSGLVYAVRQEKGWVVEEPYGGFVSYLSLSFLLDAEDRPHLTIGSTEVNPFGLYYLTRSGGSWEQQLLYHAPHAQFIPYYTSLAQDDAGTLHLSLFIDNSLWYAAKSPGGEWRLMPVADYGELISGVAMTMDQADRFHLTYVRDPNEQWRYTYFDGAEWRYETIRDAAGLWGDVDIAGDQDGFAHALLSPSSTYSLWYATNKSGAWEVIDPRPPAARQEKYGYLRPTIALDSQGNVHIVSTSTYDSRLIYLTNRGGEWQQEEVDNVGLSMTVSHKAIALDETGALHIAYMVEHEMSYFLPWLTGLKYATNQSGDWEKQWISAATFGGWHPDLTVRPDGRVLISHASGLQWLKLVEIDGEEISSTEVSPDGVEYTALAVDDAGATHLSGTGVGQVWYFFQDGDTWQRRLIDANYSGEDKISSMTVVGSSVYLVYAHTRAVWLADLPAGETRHR